jgi:hypothetical protein
MCPQNWLTRVAWSQRRDRRDSSHYRAISGNSSIISKRRSHIPGQPVLGDLEILFSNRVNYGDLNDKGRILRRNCTTAATITDVGACGITIYIDIGRNNALNGFIHRLCKNLSLFLGILKSKLNSFLAYRFLIFCREIDPINISSSRSNRFVENAAHLIQICGRHIHLISSTITGYL